jgi:hypothetical protein
LFSPVVVIAGQELENPLEDAALGPSVEALIDDLPVAKALGQITPRDAGAKSEENGFDEQAIVGRRTAPGGAIGGCGWVKFQRAKDSRSN